MKGPRDRTLKGWSLVEVSVATGVASVVLGLTMQVTTQTGKAVGEGLERSSLAVKASRCGRMLGGELRSLDSASVVLGNAAPPTGAFTSLTFRSVTGFDAQAGVTTLGPLTEIRFVLDAGESWGGVPTDTDGDGVMDDGSLVLFRDADGSDSIEAGEQLCVIARDVAGSELSFSLPSGGELPVDDDARLDLTFELHDRLSTGAVVAQRRNVRVALRN